eukprot:scaffold27882_cov122-Isochrysis_galbana.AAC.6
MSTRGTPRTARSSSICLRASAAACAGVTAGSLTARIFVVRKYVDGLRPDEAIARATPSRSIPGWKSMCVMPAVKASRVARSASSEFSPAVLSARVGIAAPPRSHDRIGAAPAARAGSGGHDTAAAAAAPSAARRFKDSDSPSASNHHMPRGGRASTLSPSSAPRVEVASAHAFAPPPRQRRPRPEI